MRRLFFFITMPLLIFSCKPKTQANSEAIILNYEINQKEWPKKLALNSKIKPDLVDWKEFETLETSFDALYTVKNTEDLALVIDDLIAKEKSLADSKYPVALDVPQVKSRLIMFRTFLLKAKGDLYYHLDIQKSTLELVNAYNAFRNQFNVLANNTLDTELLLLDMEPFLEE